MRVGILALLHESNTFIRAPTTLQHFREGLLLSGEAVRRELSPTHHEIGGFFAGLQDEQLDAVPLMAARAVPYGAIEAAAMQELVDSMLTELAHAENLDGLLIAPHGATVSELELDADGYWVGKVRSLVGPDMPIISTLDAHANLSQQLVDHTDAIVAYRSNPHLDQRQRGIEATRLMARTLRGEISPTQSAAFPPMAINIERQLTSDPHCRPMYELADEMLQRPEVLSNSILLGFPYADVAEMGSSAVVVTDNNQSLADSLVAELAGYLWTHRVEFQGRLDGIAQVLERIDGDPGPICLLDMGDNVGGGSPGDGTFLAHALDAKRLGPAFVCLYDPTGVKLAEEAGQGKSLKLAVGGKTDDMHGRPFEDEFTVTGLFSGIFEEPEPRHGGFTKCDQGPTAVLQSSGPLVVMLTSRRMPPFSIRQLTSCGLDPSQFRVLVAKGVNAPVAAYQPVCQSLIRVNTAGCTTADMESLTFRNRRRPMFPFELDTQWSAR